MVTISQGDNGKSFEMHKGEAFDISLDANPTTGFRWAVDKLDDTIVMYQDTDYKTAPGGGVGGGGTQNLHFKAINPGTSLLSLKYWRDFEGDKSVRERFSVTIHVK